MKNCWAEFELRRTLVEASKALARLDADRLEELALCCVALIETEKLPEVQPAGPATGDAARELSVLNRMLDSTCANLRIMHGLRDGKAHQLEYGTRDARFGAMRGSEDGND